MKRLKYWEYLLALKLMNFKKDYEPLCFSEWYYYTFVAQGKSV